MSPVAAAQVVLHFIVSYLVTKDENFMFFSKLFQSISFQCFGLLTKNFIDKLLRNVLLFNVTFDSNYCKELVLHSSMYLNLK